MQNTSKEKKFWFNKSVEDALSAFNADAEKGLSDEEVDHRIKNYGHNELVEQKTRTVAQLLWEQLTATMVVILIIAAVISLFIDQQLEAFSIFAIVILFTILGFAQEYRAEKAMAAL